MKVHEAWIGDVTDGSRQVLKLCDWHGHIRYVLVHDILEKCPTYGHLDAANAGVRTARIQEAEKRKATEEAKT